MSYSLVILTAERLQKLHEKADCEEFVVELAFSAVEAAYLAHES